MFINSKVRYAIIAILNIASNRDVSFKTIAEISDCEDISHHYLEQIFLKLKNAGLLMSLKGPGGGYKLAKNIEDRSIYDVIIALDEDEIVPQCGHSPKCFIMGSKCNTHKLWKNIEHNIKDYLKSIKIIDIAYDQSNSRKSERIYLDHNATTNIKQNVIKSMIDLYQMGPMNPSSIHFEGRAGKAIIEKARIYILNKLGLTQGFDGYNLVFTASGTEANNLVLYNFANKHIVISETEHDSVMNVVKAYSNVHYAKMLPNGQIDLVFLESILQSIPQQSLISIMIANNESGIVQEKFQDIISLAHRYNMYIHTDAVQALSKIEFNMQDVDFLTISSHKVGGPIGVGAFIYKTLLPIVPQIIGGGQERGVRSGTENIAAIKGFEVALETLNSDIDRYKQIKILRDILEDTIYQINPQSILFKDIESRLPNTSVIYMPNVEYQKQLIHFDLNGISVSAGSACSSGKVKNSHVLKSYGFEEAITKCSIRISLGLMNTKNDIENFIKIWEKIYKQNNG
jgi:cysteine desulfurase